MDGGFGSEAGATSDPDFTAWVSIALLGAGINPQIQKKPGGTDAYSYLLAHAGEMSYTTDFERELLVVDGAGTSPHDFAGVDLVAKILERELPEPDEGVAFPHEAGSKQPGMNDTIFAVLALSPIHEPAVESAVQQAATWIEHEQNANGSWPAWCPKTASGCTPLGKEPQDNTEMTGAAIEALNAAGRHDTAAQTKALAYLHTTQVATEGGFPQQLGEGEANVGSTAWVVQGLWAAGVSPEDNEWKPGGVDPLSYLESMQQPDGHVKYMRKEEKGGVWMTAYAGPALFGEPLPPTPTWPETPIPAVTNPGSGGEGIQSGAGADAGGGGEGAPLFSRPQPGSKGHTPGGARVLPNTLDRKKHGPRAARRQRAWRRRNPGPPRRQRAPSLEREAARAAEALPTSAANGNGPRAPGSSDSPGIGSAPVKGRLSVPPAPANTDARLQEVKGIPIGSPHSGVLEPGAPGLHGAGQKPAPATLAIAIAAVALMLAFGGAALEYTRPQTIQ
jgi:Squalene-hopene cyclase C-terminal domain